MPRRRFFIVGSNPTAEVTALGRRTRGRSSPVALPDVRPYLAHAAVVVAPLRLARGVQNKVLEALAMARPVVATPNAVQGIPAASRPACGVPLPMPRHGRGDRGTSARPSVPSRGSRRSCEQRIRLAARRLRHVRTLVGDRLGRGAAASPAWRLSRMRGSHRSRRAVIGLALLGSLALLVWRTYRDTFASIVEKWDTDAAFSHGFLIVPISLWLVWRRGELAATSLRAVGSGSWPSCCARWRGSSPVAPACW